MGTILPVHARFFRKRGWDGRKYRLQSSIVPLLQPRRLSSVYGTQRRR